ncbi:MAG: ABC transporter ATP-binding protein, partial [Pseudolabrys sp.]
AVIRQALVDLAARGSAVLVISQDLDELFEIVDRIAVMFHGTLSPPLDAAAATREKLGLLMGGSGASDGGASQNEASDAIGA